nr:TLE family member 5 [Vicugna pacos]
MSQCIPSSPEYVVYPIRDTHARGSPGPWKEDRPRETKCTQLHALLAGGPPPSCPLRLPASSPLEVDLPSPEGFDFMRGNKAVSWPRAVNRSKVPSRYNPNSSVQNAGTCITWAPGPFQQVFPPALVSMPHLEGQYCSAVKGPRPWVDILMLPPTSYGAQTYHPSPRFGSAVEGAPCPPPRAGLQTHPHSLGVAGDEQLRAHPPPRLHGERRGQEARAGAAPGAVNTAREVGREGGRCSCAGCCLRTAQEGGGRRPCGVLSPLAPSLQGSSHLPQQLKFTTSDSCDRIKDEFQLLQAQYHSLKLECDKLASEKSEMQRHYVMYYEMSYGLNIEMHKQAEIVKRLNGICAQVLPYLSQEHQQQVLGAIERAKQVTAPELNSIIRQQLQAHQLSQLQALALPLTPLPVGLQPPSLPAVSAGTGLLSLSALGSQAHLSKEDKNGHDGDTHQEDDGEKSD